MRAFIAIEISEEARAALAALQEALRPVGADVGWTRPESLHLTLRFLGEIDERQAGAVAAAMREGARAWPPLALRLSGTGAFPNARRPRILWAGLDGELERLAGLQAAIEARLVGLGFAREEKPFHPHLTLGRIKTERRTRELLAEAARHPLPAPTWTGAEIVLMQSELLRTGARYSVVAHAPLRCV